MCVELQTKRVHEKFGKVLFFYTTKKIVEYRLIILRKSFCLPFYDFIKYQTIWDYLLQQNCIYVEFSFKLFVEMGSQMGLSEGK